MKEMMLLHVWMWVVICLNLQLWSASWSCWQSQPALRQRWVLSLKESDSTIWELWSWRRRAKDLFVAVYSVLYCIRGFSADKRKYAWQDGCTLSRYFETHILLHISVTTKKTLDCWKSLKWFHKWSLVKDDVTDNIVPKLWNDCLSL